jgi:hypothetical protein
MLFSNVCVAVLLPRVGFHRCVPNFGGSQTVFSCSGSGGLGKSPGGGLPHPAGRVAQLTACKDANKNRGQTH